MGISKIHHPRTLLAPYFLHRIITSGESTSRYLFHEVENAANLGKVIIVCENNYNR